jgi:hypothetical protein
MRGSRSSRTRHRAEPMHRRAEDAGAARFRTRAIVRSQDAAAHSQLAATPVVIGEIEIDVSSMLGDADVDRALGSINYARASSQSRAERISAAVGDSRSPDNSGAATSPEPLATNWPRFSVALDTTRLPGEFCYPPRPRTMKIACALGHSL